MANTRSDLEGERAERARAMFKSRAGYVGALTKLQGNIEELMENSGTLEDLKSKRKSYDEVWRKFVSTHEEYIDCLEYYFIMRKSLGKLALVMTSKCPGN